MKPEFPALNNATKLVRDFFDFGLMRKFANLMDGATIINNDGLGELNEKYKKAQDAVEQADEEGLRVSQQANELTQQFYFELLKDFQRIAVFNEYSPGYIEKVVVLYNLQFPDKKIDFESLVIYNLYIDGLVGGLKRLYNFYTRYYEKRFEEHPKDTAAKPIILSTPIDRLKVSVNAEQLAVLFRLLHDCDIIISSKGDIHEFVADHIQTSGMPNKRISSQNFGKLFSSKKSDIRNFWIARLTKMIEVAKKK